MFLYRFIKEVLFSPWVVAVSLIVGGVLILLIERVRPRPRVHDVERMSWGTALGDRLLPDPGDDPRRVARRRDDHGRADAAGRPRRRRPNSRSSWRSRRCSAPPVYDLYKNRAILSTDGAVLIAVGFVVAFIAALFVVRWLVDFVSRHGFGVFAWYRIVVGAIALIALALAIRRSCVRETGSALRAEALRLHAGIEDRGGAVTAYARA